MSNTNNYIMADDWVPIMTELMQEGKKVLLTPHGFSMYPLIVGDRDQVQVTKIYRKLRRGDIVLYRRDCGSYILHRIHHIDKKKNDYEFYMIGDSQSDVEGPINEKQIKALAEIIIRKNRRINVNNILYRFFSESWLLLRVYRVYLLRIYLLCKRKYKQVKKLC